MTEFGVPLDTAQVQGPQGQVFVRLMHRNSGAGDTAALVFLHPVNLNSLCWIGVAERMRDVLCVLIDSRGHGRSHMNGPFGIDDYAADVMATVEAFGLRAVHLAGASLGGSVACAVAAAIPDAVQSLTALGASLEPAAPDSLAALAKWRTAGVTAELFDAFLAQEVRHGLPPVIAGDVRRQMDLDARSSDLIKEVTWNAFAEDGRRYAKCIRCPALVLTGEHDESCPPAAGAQMAAALGAPFEILPGLGHFPMMQAPALVADRLTRFIHGVALP
ncbi:MAG TPA: alpha/beta hydrolase [Steroidobacteraceae bacterium]